jgi:hypothetical protein
MSDSASRVLRDARGIPRTAFRPVVFRKYTSSREGAKRYCRTIPIRGIRGEMRVNPEEGIPYLGDIGVTMPYVTISVDEMDEFMTFVDKVDKMVDIMSSAARISGATSDLLKYDYLKAPQSGTVFVADMRRVIERGFWPPMQLRWESSRSSGARTLPDIENSLYEESGVVKPPDFNPSAPTYDDETYTVKKPPARGSPSATPPMGRSSLATPPMDESSSTDRGSPMGRRSLAMDTSPLTERGTVRGGEPPSDDPLFRGSGVISEFPLASMDDELPVLSKLDAGAAMSSSTILDMGGTATDRGMVSVPGLPGTKRTVFTIPKFTADSIQRQNDVAYNFMVLYRIVKSRDGDVIAFMDTEECLDLVYGSFALEAAKQFCLDVRECLGTLGTIHSLKILRGEYRKSTGDIVSRIISCILKEFILRASSRGTTVTKELGTIISQKIGYIRNLGMVLFRSPAARMVGYGVIPRVRRRGLHALWSSE